MKEGTNSNLKIIVSKQIVAKFVSVLDKELEAKNN